MLLAEVDLIQVGTLITAAVGGVVLLYKSYLEGHRQLRIDVVNEWQKMHEEDQKRNRELELRAIAAESKAEVLAHRNADLEALDKKRRHENNNLRAEIISVRTLFGKPPVVQTKPANPDDPPEENLPPPPPVPLH